MKTAIHMGADKESVAQVGELIADILHAPGGDEAKVAAFEAMSSTLSVSDVTISGSTFGDRQTVNLPPLDLPRILAALGLQPIEQAKADSSASNGCVSGSEEEPNRAREVTPPSDDSTGQ